MPEKFKEQEDQTKRVENCILAIGALSVVMTAGVLGAEMIQDTSNESAITVGNGITGLIGISLVAANRIMNK